METTFGCAFFRRRRLDGGVGECGVGFVIGISMVKNLQELPFGKSECIVFFCVCLCSSNVLSQSCLCVLRLWAPESDILSFYADLGQVFLDILDADKIILLGDLNTRVGRDCQTWSCLGLHGVDGADSNDLWCLQFCREYGLVFGNAMVLMEKQIQGYMVTPTFLALVYDRLYHCSLPWSPGSLQCLSSGGCWLLDWPPSFGGQVSTQSSSKSWVYHLTTPGAGGCVKIAFFRHRVCFCQCNLLTWTWWDKRGRILELRYFLALWEFAKRGVGTGLPKPVRELIHLWWGFVFSWAPCYQVFPAMWKRELVKNMGNFRVWYKGTCTEFKGRVCLEGWAGHNS